MMPRPCAWWTGAASVSTRRAAGAIGLRRAAQALGEAAALDVLHREVRLAVQLADVVDVDDVRVAQAGDGLGSWRKRSRSPRVGAGAVAQHLDGDDAV